MSAIKKAIEIAGSQEKLGDLAGTSQQNVSNWLKTGRVTAEFVIAVENATGVSRHDLRPDLYPVEQLA